jgi:hypothetical protein
MWAQILVPIIAAALLFVTAGTLLMMATSNDRADVARWAAISTIWFVVPAVFAGLIALVLLVAMIYLAGLLTGLIPVYSYRAQRVSLRVAAGARSAAEMARRPALIVRAVGGLLRSGMRRARERM